ncbi:MAG: Flp pilus assembly complex ATPase component TadA [Ruminococcus sp.]|nr:Flp pilus assembly complex ATPase component TadA [Ruminococcus sp.]
MSILEERLKKKKQEQERIKQNIEVNPTILTSSQQSIVDDVTKEISQENYDSISKNGVKGTADALIKSAHEKIEKMDISYEDKVKIEKNIRSNISGLGPIEEYMNDPEVTEIMVLKYNHIVIEKDNKKITTNAAFTSEEHLQNVIQKIVMPVGRQINLSTPIVDARLSDGSRVNATIPPISVDGATLTIRKFSTKALTGEDYINLGTMNSEILEFLKLCVKGKCNIIVSGGTNTGKTTLLNMLSSYIPGDEMIVTIEDSCELKIKSSNIRRLEARTIVNPSEKVMVVDIQALVKNSLRMNPDRIIVGEIRDGTIVDMISAMSTGHEGSMSTAHANSPANLVNSRIPIFYSMAKANFSAETQALQVSESLDLIVQLGFRNHKRVITSVTEVGKVVDGRIELKDIFIYKNGFEATGYIPKALIYKIATYGVKCPEELFKRVDSNEVKSTMEKAMETTVSKSIGNITDAFEESVKDVSTSNLMNEKNNQPIKSTDYEIPIGDDNFLSMIKNGSDSIE